MKRSLPVIFFFLLHCIQVHAQMHNHEFGARSKSLGHASSTLTDAWSIYNNVGGISGVEHGTVFFGYDKIQNLEGFDKVAAGIIQPLKVGNVGVALFKFGDELYSEQSVSLAYGSKVGFVRLGIKANYFQMRIDELGSAGALSFDIGGTVELIPKLNFGAYISNFTLAKLSNPEHSELPVFMKLGLAYLPVDELSLYLDLCKDVANEAVVRAGIEYTVGSKFYLRTGVNTEPWSAHFGGGVLLRRFRIDYAFSNNDFLGASHQASISFTYSNHED
jgi:hypothetical protein